MRMSSSVYVGVYVECKNELIGVETERKRCPHDHVENELYMDFCPKCGIKLIVEMENTGRLIPVINAHDLIEDLDEDLLPVTLDNNVNTVFIINGEYKWGYDLGDSDDIAMEIHSHFPGRASEWFINEYEKQLEILKQTYGGENVKVKYGIVKHYD